jgi:glycosyltransferase involved in cell wall biosynthesis
MKILHVIPSISLKSGGPSHALIEMITELNKQGIDAEVATTNDDCDGLLKGIALNKRVDFKNIPVFFFSKLNLIFDRLTEFQFSIGLTIWLFFNRKKYTVLHIHSIFSFPSTIAMFIARKRGVPYIIRPLGQLCKWSLNQKSLKKNIYLKLIERANINGSTYIQYMSEDEAEEAIELAFTTKTVVIPHGLNIPEYNFTKAQAREAISNKWQIPINQPIILFLSRIHPKKGLDLLINSIAELTERNFHLVVAGTGELEYFDTIKQLIHKKDLTNQVTFTGFVEGTDKKYLLKGADLFTLTSYSENFGVVVLESLAAGTHVLITKGIPFYHEVLKYDLGYVVDANTESIVRKLSHWLNKIRDVDLNLSNTKLPEYVEKNYSWRMVVKKLNDLYSSKTH